MHSIKILSGLLTPTIAILAVYIAYRQYQTAKAKLKLDLYEKRLNIFHNFKTFIYLRITKLEFEENELKDFERNTNECIFLFGDEIIAFRNDLIIKSKDLTKKDREIKRRIREESLHSTDPKELERLQKERGDILFWFDFEHGNIENRLNKYLNFRKL